MEEETTKRASRAIYDFFEPLVNKHAKTAEVRELEDDILQLCKDAYQLRMKMRRSKEGYACQIPTTSTSGKLASLVANEELAEGFCVENGKNSEGSDAIA